MHDIRLLRDQLDHLREGMRRRGKLAELQPLLDRAEALERERRAAITEVEAQQARRNKVTQEVAARRKAGEDATALIAEGRAIGDAIGALEARRNEADAAVQAMLYELPNIPLADVPEGDESANTVVSSWGAPRDDGATLTPHWDKGAELGVLDLARGAKISGSGFIVYRGAGARLVRSLMNLMLDIHTTEHGYEETWVPFVVNRASMTGTGNFPKFEEDAYAVTADELFLIPTAEVPVTNLYRDEILELSDLPKTFCAYSACFRREAGAAGKDTRGLLRVHQFDKVELVRYATPETSRQELELLTSQAETILQRLELPYRRVLLAAGDTGFSSAMTYDLEVFAPAVGKWLEVSSCSVFADFQARRANIRYRPAPGEKPRFVHTLNGSALAFSRIIACLLEHHQQADGSVRIPEALQPWLGRAVLR
ncbi:MAG: serine--tRNA ligase [Gemmatimonas sp.]|jgi:seryl-tRNA synthetase|uniref:serine--tRNA ligase n=2 Tax=Gemmatimonas sp. TaxID=1962908 RepID=UPI0025BA6385|nr:serine--tRNA ligase [Gemmatimonas sp.]MCE2954838.1 serine--tRNA ligase [Gemmatimonas sp.]